MKKDILFKIVMVIYLSIVGTVFTHAQTFVYKSHTNATIASYSMPYRLFIPTGYNANTSYPLVLFLHGAGERGTDNNVHISSSRGATLWAETANQASHPCFVIAPQCPANKQWVNTNWSLGSYSITNIPMSTELKMVKDIIETLQTQYNIDPSRLYITGLSMGGYGTWDFILRYPTMFKAAIPICGAGDPSKASLISTVPLRVFHSSDDNIVPVTGSRDMVNAIKAFGPNTRTEFYTEYTDQGHFSWVNAYNTPDLANWLFTTNPIKVGLIDITDEPGTITVQGENLPGQLKVNVFDNDINTTWFDFANDNPASRSSWIQYQLSGSSYVVTQYILTSANNFPDRDPKSWNLLGSNNGTEWTTLDTRSNEVFSSRSLKNTYTFTNSAAYSYYKLQINSVNNPATAIGVQLAEFEILGTPVVTNITVFPTILNLGKNDFSQLYATVTPLNASNSVTWSSSNEAVVTVSSTGLINAVGAGVATITASAANNNKTATCSVVVGSGIITYEAENATYGGGNSIGKSEAGYSGTGYLRNFNSVGSYVEFSITGAVAGSQDVILHYTTGVAGSLNLYVNGIKIGPVTIPSTGGWSIWKDYAVNVTLNAGNNTIKFQHDADNTGNILYYIDYLTVAGSIIPVTGVIMSSTTLSVAVNVTSQLTATVAPSDASNKAVSWSSSNTEVATVSASGLVTGVTVGDATITVTTVDGSHTATCDVTVIASDPTKYEAENAIFGGGNWIGTSDAGYSGTGYLRNFNSVGSYVEFSITGAVAGSQNVILHYTTGVAGSLNLYVNGIKIGPVTIPSTGGWSNWQDYAVNVTLNAGNNTIKFQHDADNTGNFFYYIDYLRVAGVSAGINSRRENENDISLFPNPLSTGSLLIKLPEGATQLSIFDITGKAVYEKQVTKNEYLIDQSVFESEGVYIVNVRTSTNPINKKFIVTK